jgi:hypothetical protein
MSLSFNAARMPPIRRRSIGRVVAMLGLLSLLQVPTTAVTLADELVSLKSHNFPTRFVRHNNFLGDLTLIQNTVGRADATFFKRRALSKTPGAVSFESVNFPGRFLRHRFGRIRLDLDDGTALFRADASFHERNGLGSRRQKSYESVNFPGRFIRHRGFRLWLDARDDTAVFAADATFRSVTGLAVASFEAFQLTDHFVRHRLLLGEISRIVTDVDRADASFIVIPALNGAAGSVSFRSVNFPFRFLRHSFFRIRLDRHDGTRGFDADASFRERSGLASSTSVSYESSNFPGRFIRHRNLQLWLDPFNNSVPFFLDATFRKKRGFFFGTPLD